MHMHMHIMHAMDLNYQVDVVYTDFSKAFDKINHKLLITKLREIGIHGSLLRWIESYIRNRSQAVCLKGYSSSYLPVPSGVPQGSHLGPVLFSLYVNDICKAIRTPDYLLYADDTKLFRVISCPEDCHKLQLDLNSLTDYCKSNQLFLNVDKCHLMTYTRRTNPISYNYHLNGMLLKKVNTTRDLGIIMDDHVSFNLHIDSIIKRTFRSLGFINRITQPFRHTSTLRILYFSYVRSVLDFGSAIWNPCYKVHIDRIEKIQKKFINILNYRFRIHTSYDHSLTHFNLLSLEISPSHS